ncbi:hypothetical protein [Paenibacillus sp. YYML68]|uniref:hypothetical protein n=1 Tax=Paenibacillus sp. YYML68 TaxID=2909250 RepID=UPI0024902B6F|nr:hypothetical protein [Paenibacillus sp. YYML68]
MKIETNQYEIAPLTQTNEALRIIQEAESKLAQLTGDEITLIAYTQAEDGLQ